MEFNIHACFIVLLISTCQVLGEATGENNADSEDQYCLYKNHKIPVNEVIEIRAGKWCRCNPHSIADDCWTQKRNLLQQHQKPMSRLKRLLLMATFPTPKPPTTTERTTTVSPPPYTTRSPPPPITIPRPTSPTTRGTTKSPPPPVVG